MAIAVTCVWHGKGSQVTFPALSHSYIWQHIEIGYVQGMCDLLAPLLVILDDGEWVAFPMALQGDLWGWWWPFAAGGSHFERVGSWWQDPICP